MSIWLELKCKWRGHVPDPETKYFGDQFCWWCKCARCGHRTLLPKPWPPEPEDYWDEDGIIEDVGGEEMELLKLQEENENLKRKIKALTAYDISDGQLEILLNLFDRLIDKWDEQYDTMDDLTVEIFETLQEAVSVIKDRERFNARK